MKNPKIEILCVTMGQTDFCKVEEMNVRCDIVLANQGEGFAYSEKIFSGYRARMITTGTVGVGKNRNYAISLAEGEILLMSDDDMVYEDDAADKVAAAFEQLPAADVIVFGTRYERYGAVYKVRLPKTGKLPFFKSLRYGSYAIAVRKDALQKANLRFSELFGGGCRYSYGEDSDFLVQCYRKRLHIYSYGYILGTTKKDRSTCFCGYGKKYHYDKGALARHTFGALAIPYMIYMSCKRLEGVQLSALDRFRYMRTGYRQFPKLVSFEEWVKYSETDSHCEQ